MDANKIIQVFILMISAAAFSGCLQATRVEFDTSNPASADLANPFGAGGLLGSLILGQNFETAVPRPTFVAVGEDAGTTNKGFITSSTDGGQTWIKALSSTTHAFKSVTYCNRRFVAVGWSTNPESIFYYSDDALTWNQAASTFTSHYIRDVICHSNSFVAVGYSAGIAYHYTSTDGISWTYDSDGAVAAAWDTAATNGTSVYFYGRNSPNRIVSSDMGNSGVVQATITGTPTDAAFCNNGHFMAFYSDGLYNTATQTSVSLTQYNGGINSITNLAGNCYLSVIDNDGGSPLTFHTVYSYTAGTSVGPSFSQDYRGSGGIAGESGRYATGVYDVVNKKAFLYFSNEASPSNTGWSEVTSVTYTGSYTPKYQDIIVVIQ